MKPKRLKFLVHESLTITDNLRAELEIDAIIYRNEFDKYYSQYIKSEENKDLIFTYIFLQIYLECFLHQNMRRIIGLEFKTANSDTYKEWMSGEGRLIRDKIKPFIANFYNPVPSPINLKANELLKSFAIINRIRNKFLHGHKVSEWMDTELGAGKTEAKQMLEFKYFIEVLYNMNTLINAWNHLLSEIQEKCVILRSTNDFKCTPFIIKKLK